VYAAEQALLPHHLQARSQLLPSLTSSPAVAKSSTGAPPATGGYPGHAFGVAGVGMICYLFNYTV